MQSAARFYVQSFGPEARTTDLKIRLDRATYYCFTTQVIGAILVGPNLLLIGGI